MRILAVLASLLFLACGETERSAPIDESDDVSVFDPLTETLDRAEGVQDTLNQQAEELRRRLEEDER